MTLNLTVEFERDKRYWTRKEFVEPLILPISFAPNSRYHLFESRSCPVHAHSQNNPSADVTFLKYSRKDIPSCSMEGIFE